MALTNAQLKERKRLLDEIAKSEEDIAAHTAVIEKGEGLTNKQLEDRARLRAKDQQTLKENRKLLADIQKDEDKINAKNERRNQLGKEYVTIGKDIQASIAAQPKHLKSINIAQGGIINNLREAEKLEAKGSANMTRREKKELTMRRGISEVTQDILDNSANIATEEFTTFDLQKKINWARREGFTILADDLEQLQEMQKAQKHMNDIAVEGANLMRAPIDKLRDVVESVPGGKFISKLLGLETLGDKISKGLLTAFRTLLGLEDKLPDAKEAPGKVMGSKGRMVTEGLPAHKRDVKNKWFDSKEYKEMAESQEDAAESAEDQAEAAEDTKDATEGAGKAMGGLKLSAIGILAAVIAWVVETVKFSMELGVAYGELSAIAVFFKEQTKATLTEFGSMRGVSDSLLANMWLMEKTLGAQAADIAKILVLQTSITDQTRDMALKEQHKWIESIQNEGLSVKDVFADMAQNADYIAIHMKEGGKNMVEATAAAHKMGLSLSETASIANKLLDWETSIKDEMELSLLLNRDINFDKARGLVLAGKTTEAAAEVKRQMGGEAAFTAAGIIARQKMGEAIGLQGKALAEFMQTDQQRVEAQKQATEDQAKADEAAAAEKAKMWGLIGMAAGAVVVAIGAGLAAAVTLGSGGGWGAAKTLAAFLGGGVVGGAAGYGIGSVASKSIGGGVITPTGQVVQTDPRDYLMAGTASELSSPMKGQDSAQSREQAVRDKKKIEQNDEIITLLRKMPTAYLTEQLSGNQVSATKKVGTLT